jgi:hypothetical protein
MEEMDYYTNVPTRECNRSFERSWEYPNVAITTVYDLWVYESEYDPSETARDM